MSNKTLIDAQTDEIMRQRERLYALLQAHGIPCNQSTVFAMLVIALQGLFDLGYRIDAALSTAATMQASMLRDMAREAGKGGHDGN